MGRAGAAGLATLALLLARAPFELSAATLPPHRPLRILVVGDDVNPHGLPAGDLTEVHDIYLTLSGAGTGLNISATPNAVVEVATNSIENATAALSVPRTDPAAYDAVVYFAHRIPNNGTALDNANRQAAFVAAVQSFLVAGGGFVCFHHGAYFTSGKEGILDLIGATASGAVPWDTVNGQDVIDVAPGHFVTTNGVTYTGSKSYSDVPRGVPAATYSYFNNTPDERYPVYNVNPSAGALRLLFASDYSDTGTTHVLGFTHHRTGWNGLVVAYQPAEYQPHALNPADVNFQILANAIVHAAGAASARLFTLSPCRAVDTRGAQAPALGGGSTRTFPVTGVCGIPATARAVAANVTVTGGSADGYLTVYPGNGALPPTSTINYRAAQTRANGAVLRLAEDGTLSVFAGQAGGSVDVILDVVGYLE